MGIRSLLRNAFGRSKATREETGAAPSGADKPESATIPEAREESTPAPAAPEAEVPAARTAPTEAPAADPAPTTPTLPAQGSRVDRTERAEQAPESSPVREEAAVSEETAAAVSGEAIEAVEAAEPVVAVEGVEEPAAEAAAPEATSNSAEDAAEQAVAAATSDKDEPAADVAPAPATEPATGDTVADLVSQAFDNPSAEAEADQPKAEAVTPSAAAASLPTTAPALVSLYKAAGSTLEKHGLATQRAAVYLVLDRSGSMRPYYKDGTVQNLAEQALGLSAHLDDDATVPVIFFSTDIDGTADLDLTNYEGRIEELHAGLGHMGRTNYHWAINAVVDHYKKSGATAPAFVIFQTDGAPTSKPAAEKALCEAAGLPIFWQFIGFGDPDAKGFDFLRKLDDLAVPEKRTVDNAGFFHAGRDPRSLPHDELYQQLMVEFPEWLTEARAAGVLKDS
ncbi:VWA domain-containing protein [Streptomyces platensis]|uniref:VWA domain-containing protein n=1 Tax=Streptomyces platensis TaxID=58346 RepID=UPI0030E2E883